MALKTLLLRKKLSDKRKEEAELRSQQAAFEKREAEIAQAIEEAETEEDKAAVEAAVEELEANQKTVKERLVAIGDEIASIVQDIEESEAAQEEALNQQPSEDPANDEGDGQRSRQRKEHRSMNRMELREAQEFQKTGKHAYKDMRSIIRAALTTAGTVGPTSVSGINDAVGSGISSLVDMVTITDCTGMSSYKIALNGDDSNIAGEGTEGEAPGELNYNFDSVELTPKLYDTIGYVSKQIRKQTPLAYEEKVYEMARKALRRRANSLLIAALKESEQVDSVSVTAIGPNTLSDLILAYGGDEGVEGAAVLILCKADLKAFAAVRGKNEYLPVYSIIPDAANPSTGIIKDNSGLSCRYCLNKNLSTISAAGGEMYYGAPSCLELGLWGDFEVEVNEGYKFGEGLLTVRGDVTMDADVNAKHGFVRAANSAG